VTTLVTARLVLGPHREDDLERLHRWENDEEIVAMSEDEFHEAPLDEIRERLARWSRPMESAARFAVRLVESGAYIGYVNLGEIERAQGRCKLGYVIGEKALWGRGYATEAVRAVVAHAFGPLGLHRIQAGAYATNAASIRVLEKVGFRREGVLRAHVRRGDAFIDEILFGILSGDRPAAGG
jgi:ribosomal-protein-alanine N-acetyltransferase